MTELRKTGIENLANAIVERTFEDYMMAIQGHRVEGRNAKWVKEDCERFFKSDWCKTLTNDTIDPDVFIREAHNRVIEEYEARIEELKKKIEDTIKSKEERLSLM